MLEENFRAQIYEKAVQIELDLLDRKILYLLSVNARFSNVTIAKALKTSREVVAYRIKKMQASSFLHGFLTHINPRKLGFNEYIIYLKLRTLSNEKEMIESLLTVKELTGLKTCSGKYDLQIIFSTKTLEELDILIKRFFNQYNDIIQDYVILTVVDMGFLGIRLLVDDESVNELDKVKEIKGSSFFKELEKYKNNSDIVSLDEVDKKILKNIEMNARISLIELSKSVDLSPLSVKNRFKNLINKGVIKGFVPYFAMVNIGYQWYEIFLRFQNLNETKFIEYIKRNKYLLWQVKFIGQLDYQVSVFAKNHAHFHDILNELRNEFSENLISYDSVIVFNQFLFKPRID